MGADYIREQSGQPWRKRWDKGVDRLKMPSLFDVQFSAQQRVITVELVPGIELQAGEQLVVQCESGGAIICRGHSRIGGTPTLPSSMQSAINNSGGVALGTVERVGLFGNTAELTIR